jgi:hypothetical protein
MPGGALPVCLQAVYPPVAPSARATIVSSPSWFASSCSWRPADVARGISPGRATRPTNHQLDDRGRMVERGQVQWCPKAQGNRSGGSGLCARKSYRGGNAVKVRKALFRLRTGARHTVYNYDERSLPLLAAKFKSFARFIFTQGARAPNVTRYHSQGFHYGQQSGL